MKIEIRSAAHRKIAISDILPNPHRDLKLNPVEPERVEALIGSFERTGFWDNIIVRPHPKREDKYELAYGHNRLWALKDKRIDVDTITIPVVKLNDWEMYCAMVDENELGGRLTPKVVIENINVGCDLIEKALKAIGPDGSYEAFLREIGCRDESIDSTRKNNDHGFEQVRDAFFDGEGLGRQFLIDFLPCGKMRDANITTVLATRYGKTRKAAKARKAKEKKGSASAKRAKADKETDKQKAEKLREQATKEEAQAAKLEAEAKTIGLSTISEKVLLLFDTPNRMTDFADAVRRAGIPPDHHEAAAKFIINEGVMHDGILPKLCSWWDGASGAGDARSADSKRQRDDEDRQKRMKGATHNGFLVKLGDDLRAMQQRLEIAIQYADDTDERGCQIIADKFVPLAELLTRLIDLSRGLPDKKMTTINPKPHLRLA